jgi:hypothetical protein
MTGPVRSSQPPPIGIGAPDEVRAVFWQAFRHLFPPHALATQAPNGSLVITWSILGEPGAWHPYAAPVMLRFEPALLALVAQAPPQHRLRIAQKYEPLLREGLRGYDPFARFPNARVVPIG